MGTKAEKVSENMVAPAEATAGVATSKSSDPSSSGAPPLAPFLTEAPVPPVNPFAPTASPPRGRSGKVVRARVAGHTALHMDGRSYDAGISVDVPIELVEDLLRAGAVELLND